jgi:hypothetical protein
MAKSKSRKYSQRKNKKTKKGNIFKSIGSTTSKAVPMVTSGLKKVGSSVVNVTKKTVPIVEKGVGAIYNTLASGFDLGIKGVKKGINFVKPSKKRRSKGNRKNKSRRK